ncbi:cytochrome P450 [Rhizoctonia solani]|nr:cytochrome P450 [Rhizoctonia solani]
MTDTRIGLYMAPASVALLLLHQYWCWVRQPTIRQPPTPLSLPFVGNLFSIPSGPEYHAFAKLGEQLKSDIVFLNLLGHKLVVLNSAEAASDILEKRSALYSDRPQIPMVTDPGLMNWSRMTTIVGYNDLWRHYRRLMNNWLNTRAVNQFNNLQEQQARLLLKRLLNTANQSQPFEDTKKEFFFAMGSSMLQLAYGYKPEGPQDPFFKEALLAFHNVMSAGMQTNFFVNTFPMLLYVPDWLPGTGWKRTGKQWGAQQDKAKTNPYEWVKAEVAKGTHQPSLLSSLLQDHELLLGLSPTEGEARLKEIGIVLFGGGTDTSANFLVSFVAAMILHPHAQARAQQELDTVLGHAVLPSISDKERLPYIRNLIDEVFRLYPVAPLAIPHACFQDDTYRGYDIQKGTVILGNIWAIGRDSRHYKDPEIFNPDRYLNPNVPRPPVFGWGRRKCPGIHFAEASVFINIASLLATFTFSKKKDSSGQEIMPQIEVERNSIMLELKPFQFELKPRSDEHYELILGPIATNEEYTGLG